MKENKISFEIRFSKGYLMRSEFKIFDITFDFEYLDYYTYSVLEKVIYRHKEKL